MKSPIASLSSVPERLLALVFLISLLPMLLLIAWFLRSNTDEPVLLLDRVRAGSTTVQSHRFRTTGRGSNAFLQFGRFLREYGFDKLLALWSVLRGDITFRQLLQLLRAL